MADPNPYEEHQEQRRARLEAKAAAARDEAQRAHAAANRISDGIPMGQPVLVGHHSEGRHRRDLARMGRNMDRAVEASKKAQEYERQAKAVGRGGISSDDPEAVPKLRREVEALEERQRRMKAVNLAHQNYVRDPATLETAPISDEMKRLVRTYVPAYTWEPHPFAPYQLQNNAATIRNKKKRITELEARSEDEGSERVVSGVRVVENVEANRLQLFFPDKPDEATRTALKQSGFRFAPSVGAWQRHRSNGASYAAERILARLTAEAAGDEPAPDSEA